MSDQGGLINEVSKAHPNFAMGGREGVRCVGCNLQIIAVNGSYTEGWHQHLIRAALEAARGKAAPAGVPSERADAAAKKAYPDDFASEGDRFSSRQDFLRGARWAFHEAGLDVLQ